MFQTPGDHMLSHLGVQLIHYWKVFPSAGNAYKCLPSLLKEFHLQPVMAVRRGQISALARLISDATKTVEAHYAKSPKPYIPSLDDTEPHPLDEQLAGKELRTAVQTIEGACAQLSATVARPSHTIVNVRWHNFCLHII